MIDNETDPLRRIPVNPAPAPQTGVGAALRAARTKRGQTIESVAEATRIPKRYLDALEGDRLDEFPAFVYMRGFLKSYCDHLDLPFDELWARVAAASAPAAPAGSSSSGAPAAPASASSAAPARTAVPPTPAPAVSSARVPAPTSGGRSPARSAAPDEPGGLSAAFGAGLVATSLALGAVVWIVRHRSGAAPAATQAAVPETPAAREPEPAPAPAPAAAPVPAPVAVSVPAPAPVPAPVPAPAPAPPPAPTPVPAALQPVVKPAGSASTRVVLRATEDCWTRISVDGKVLFEGRLPRGAAMDWTPAKSLTLRATAPSALQVEVNGEPRPLGAASPDGEYTVVIP